MMEDDDGIEHPPPSDLWQILHSPRTQDGPELQFENFYNKNGIQYRATTLNFGASDWNDVIQRGYSWTDFKSFVNQRECVYVGPFWIREGCVQVDHIDTFMKLGKVYLARNPQQTDHSDDDIKSLFLSFLSLLSLHPDRKRCWIVSRIYSQAKWWLSVIQNESDIMLDRLHIHEHDHLDATTLHLTAAMPNFLSLCDCCIVSTTSTPYPQSINHSTNNRLQELQINNMKEMEVDIVASFIQKCTALESFVIRCPVVNINARVHFTSDHWMTLMEVCKTCKTLELIYLQRVNVETDVWLPGLELLMRSQSLSDIEYSLNSYESPFQEQTIPNEIKVSRANAIAQALMRNKNITRLSIDRSQIVGTTYQSTIPPILRCNRLWKKITPFCRKMDDTRGSTQLLGRLLSHRLLHQNPSFLFELVCKMNRQLSHMWYDGRHRRVLITPNKRKRDY